MFTWDDVPFVFWGDGGLKFGYLRGKQIIKNPSDCENGSVFLKVIFSVLDCFLKKQLHVRNWF